MRECQFHDPYYISSYYDGHLSEDDSRTFTDHLLTCKDCMDSLLNLERDLFLLKNVNLKEVPIKTKTERAVFRLLSEGIKLLKNLDGELAFHPVALLPVRGTKVSDVYKINKQGIEVEIRGEDENLFSMELSGVKGKKVSINRDNRLVESHSRIGEEKLTIYNLERGNYSLVVEDEDLLMFSVE